MILQYLERRDNLNTHMLLWLLIFGEKKENIHVLLVIYFFLCTRHVLIELKRCCREAQFGFAD